MVKTKSVKLWGVSGILAVALLLGGNGELAALLPDGSTAAERQQQAEIGYATGQAEEYEQFLVVDGKGYAHFEGLSAVSRGMYVSALNGLADKLPPDVRLYSVLAPTAAAFDLTEDMGGLFPDQQQLIKEAAAGLDERFVAVEIYPVLAAHKDEYLYFGSDHHWTARAGYLAYTQVAEALGLEPLADDAWPLIDSETAFLGSIAGATGSLQLSRGLDRLYYYQIPYEVKYTYWDNSGQPHASTGVYKSWYLGQANKYAFFMGGDLPYIKLETGAKTGRKLAVIKDSYANTVLPWLTAHYDEIHVIDPRNSRFNAVEIIEESGVDDVLFLNYARVLCLPEFSARLMLLGEREPVARQELAD